MYIYYFHAVIIFLILIMYLLAYSRPLVNEGFEADFYPSYCDCNQAGWDGQQACMSCNNCGWCIDPNGNGSCVQGDNRGPYFADCVQYYYNGEFGVSVAAPYGPPVAPWYQKFFVPWYGGHGGKSNGYFDYVDGNHKRRWVPMGKNRFYKKGNKKRRNLKNQNNYM